MASAKMKNAAKRIKATLDRNYTPTEATPTAGPVGSGKLFIGGQVFNGDISGVTQVVNVGRPAAAQYAAKVGGGVTVASSGGGSSTTTGGGSSGAAITSSFVIADPDALLTNARLLAVSAALSLTDAGSGGNITIGMSTPPTLSVTSTSDAATGSHAITASAAPGAAESLLKSTSAGLLTLPQFTATTKVVTPRIDTASGTLSLQPAGTTVQVVGALRSTAGTTESGGAVVQGVVDSGNSFAARAWLGHNAKWDYGADLWNIDDVGANDTSGLLLRNAAAAIDFIFHASTGASSRTMDHSTFTAGAKFTMTSAGRFGVLNTAPSYEGDITGSLRATTSVITPVLTTATNVDLVINPAGTGAVQFPNDQKIRTSTFDGWTIPYTTGFQINEFEPVPGGSSSVLTIGRIQADELDVRVFVANETRVSRGDEFWTKSFGVLAESFTTPLSIGGTVSVKFEDSPAITGAIFVNSDWVLIRKLEIDTGASLYNVWGQVATYVNNGDGTQNWTFTLRGGPTNKLIDRGSLGIDFGQVGAGLIHLSVVDASGSPYIKLRKWVSGSDPMTITGPNFKTYVQIGELGSISNSYYTPSGFGWYVQPSTSDARFIVADDNGLQIRGASFKMYDGAAQTVDISSTDGSMKLGTDVSNSATTALDFDASTGDLSITGDLYTGKVYLLQASGLNTEQDVWGSWDNRRALQWWPDLTSMTGDPSLSMYTGKHSGGSFPDQNFSYIDANPTGGQLAGLWITAFGQGTGADAIIYLEGGSQSLASTPSVSIAASAIDLVAAVAVTGSLSVGGTAVSLDGHTHSYLPLSGGALSGTLTAQNITFATDNTYDIGAADKRVQDLYAVNLHVNSIVGTPSYSHNHAASDINSGTLDFARIPTTWNGALTLDADTGLTSNYVRWTTQTATLKAWDLIGRAHDYATSAQQNDLLLTYYDGSSTYIVWQADNSTRVIDFLNTPTVNGTSVSLSNHNHDASYVPTSRTVTAGSGLTGGGALSANITLGHADTSSVGDVANTNGTVLQSVTFDTYGHVQTVASYNLDNRYYTESEITTLLASYVPTSRTVTAGAGMTGGGALSADITISHLDTSSQTTVTNTGTSFIQSVTLDTYGHVTALASADIGAALDSRYVNVTGDTMSGALTAGAGVLISSGAVGTPSLAASGDTDTGIYWPAANTLAFSMGGTQRLQLSSTGGTLTGILSITTATVTPSITTGSGNLALSSTGGTVAVTGALTGSSTATFATSVAVPLVTASSGDLTLNSAAGSVAINAATGQAVNLQVAGATQWAANETRLLPRSTVTVDIGDYNRRVRTLHAAELAVETLVAQNVMATIGGRITVAPTVKLIADLANTGTATTFNTALTSWWTLNEASGTRSDSRGSNTLTDTNTVTYAASGKQGNAASFTGSSSEKLNRSDNSSMSAGDVDFFFCAWIYPTLNNAARQTIINKGSTGTGEYRLEIDWTTSKVYWSVWNSSGTLTEVASTSTIATNTWYFVCGWHDSVGNVIGVSVNGVEATAAHSTGVRDGSGNFCLGARDTDRYYTGYIDEVGYWDAYLPSAHERRWLYNKGAGRVYADVNAQVSSTMDVDSNSLASGDFIYMAAAPGGIAQVEAMRVASSATTITGGYRYTVVRNHDGSGINSWNTGDAIIDIGGSVGAGYIDLTSTSTIHSHLGPTIAVYQRTDTGVWNETAPTVALGNLRSFVDYASDAAGLAIGNDLTLTPATGFAGLTADATNGIRLFNTELKLYSGATEAVRINATVGVRFTTGTGAINTISWYDSINGYDQAYMHGSLSGGTATLNLRAVAKDVGTGAFAGTADLILSNTVTGSSIKMLANDGSVNGPNQYMTVAHTGVTISSLGLTVAPPAGTSGLTLTTPANQNAGMIYVAPADCGSSFGPHINIGRNSNASTPAAGFLYLVARTGVGVALWVDNGGTLRLNTGALPTNANDTSGTVVGSQSSWIGIKKDITPWHDTKGALSAVLQAPLYNYRLRADDTVQYRGLVITEEDRANHIWYAENMAENQLPALNERNLFGYLIASIKEQQAQIEALEERIKEFTHDR